MFWYQDEIWILLELKMLLLYCIYDKRNDPMVFYCKNKPPLLWTAADYVWAKTHWLDRVLNDYETMWFSLFEIIFQYNHK